MVAILDTTLREGEQTPGVYFDEHIKLAIARQLDAIGVDFIESGHPLVSNKIGSAVKTIAQAGLNACVGAHSRSLKKDVDLALECGVGLLGIFYCVSSDRLNNVFNKNLDEATEQISETIAYAKSQRPELLIRYTPEDTVRSPFKNVVAASVAAVRAGADIISIADTTGFMILGSQNNFFDYVTNLRAAFDQHDVQPRIAAHCHNDRGLALANALDAYRAGVDIIDASVLGIGERAGIVDLGQLLGVLTSDFGYKSWNLEGLSDLYRLVSKHSGIPVPAHFPVTGANAFTHCAGVHTHAALMNPMHYESLSPEVVGRTRSFALDHMSGIASIRYALKEIGEEEELAPQVLSRVKAVGQQGRTVDFEELRYIVDSCRESAQAQQAS